MLAVRGAIIPMLAPNRDVRWLLTAGLFLAAAIYPLPDTHPKHFSPSVNRVNLIILHGIHTRDLLHHAEWR